MWHAFLTLHSLLQKIYILRFIYDRSSNSFKINPKANPVYHWVNLQISLVWLVSFKGIISFLKSSDMSFEYFIMDLMYWGLMIVCLSVIWTLHFRRRDAVWFMNQMMRLKDKKALSDRTLTPETLAMYTIASAALIFPVALSLLPFMFKDTPANIILRATLHHSIMKDKLTERILSSLYWLIHGFFAVIPIVQLLAVVIIVLFDSKFMMKPCYQPKGDRNRKSNHHHPNFGPAFARYTLTRLIYKSFQSFGAVLFPSLVSCSCNISIVSTYVVIKLTDILPPTLIGLMATADILITVNTAAVYGFALVITNESENFQEYWKDRVRDKIGRRMMMTYRPIRICVGSFFMVYRAIALDHMQFVVDMTVTFLLI